MAELSAPPESSPSRRRAPDQVRAAALVLAGAALFGTVGTAQLVGPQVPSLQLAAARLLAAALLLVVVASVSDRFVDIGRVARHSPVWWAAVGQAGFNLCFLGAMQQAGVAVGTLVAIGATPILTGLATRRVSRTWAVATGVAVVGLVLLVTGQARSASAPSAYGVLLALGASVSYATYIIAGNAAATRRLAMQPYLAAAFTGSALLTFPLLLVGDVGWLAEPSGLALVGYLALVPTVLAYMLFNRGLRGVRASTASTLGLIEPVVAASLAVLVVGETLTVAGAGGAVLVLAGLLLVVRAAGR